MARRAKNKVAPAPQRQVPGSAPAAAATRQESTLHKDPPPSPSGSHSSNRLSSTSGSDSDSVIGSATGSIDDRIIAPPLFPVEDTFFSICMESIDILRANNSSSKREGCFQHRCRHCLQFFRKCMVPNPKEDVNECRACYYYITKDDVTTPNESRNRDNNCQLQFHLNCNQVRGTCLKRGQIDLHSLKREVERIRRAVERDVERGLVMVVSPGEEGCEDNEGRAYDSDYSDYE